MDTKTSNTIIDWLGGTSEVARLCDVKPPSVSEWRKNGIPKPQLRYLRLARPDVFKSIDKLEEVEAAAIKRNGGIRQHGDSRDAKNISK